MEVKRSETQLGHAGIKAATLQTKTVEPTITDTPLMGLTHALVQMVVCQNNN